MNTGQNAGLAQLTTREKSILQLACDGFSDKEIATKLELSHSTILTYWTRIREKMACRSRIAVITTYLRAESEERMQALRKQFANPATIPHPLPENLGALILERMDSLPAETAATERWNAIQECLANVGAYLYCTTTKEPFPCVSITESATKLGVDDKSILNGTKSLASYVHSDDFKVLMSLMTEDDLKKTSRILYTNRAHTPKGLRTILTVGIVTDKGMFDALTVDIQPLVDSGIIPDRVLIVRE